MVEMLVALALVTVLTVIAFTDFRSVSRQWNLSATASEVTNDLARARARAIARNRAHWVVFGASGWQVYEDTNQNGGNRELPSIDRLVFSGSYKGGISYDPPTTDPLPQAGPNANTVVFDSRGLATNMSPDGLHVGLVDAQGRTRQVRVRYSGMARKI
jgi:Tfp pilus assembly protein FimT